MRVIAGKARSLPLKTVEGDATRPTTDRIKETLFNILQKDLCDIRFLDLFAGSGAIGIEALSRGAALACFVDSSRAAVNCIHRNLAFTRLNAQAEVFQCDALTALARLEGRPPFDIIFMDPPYGKGLEERVLAYIAQHRPTFVDSRTVFIVEMSLDTEFDGLLNDGFELLRVKEYKTNKHVFLIPKKVQEQEQI
ncbi:MAG: 16S rRNA (guanine(966)-N(2))-methyltransferase RsmD [Lachnospiraceae bacterium]|nr:16S rRNA (guanine(966)-N(2))-methyltransferase RsmD [Lachnospiraceae bacterium]